MSEPGQNIVIPQPVLNESRNPGCQYCSHYQTPSEAKRNEGACKANGRMVKKRMDDKNYRKWIECENPKIKNKNNRCKDFVLQNFIIKSIRRLFARYVPQVSNQKTITEKSAFIEENWVNS